MAHIDIYTYIDTYIHIYTHRLTCMGAAINDIKRRHGKDQLRVTGQVCMYRKRVIVSVYMV